MSQDLQQARYDQLIRRVGALYGGGSKVTEVLAELFPVLDVENVPSELLALMDTRLCFGRTFTAAVVAEISRSQLFNPVGSGLIVTITRLFEVSDTSQVLEHGLLTTAISAPSAVGGFRDSRFGIAGRPTAQLNVDNQAAAQPAIFRTRVGTTETYQWWDQNDIAVLEPGTGFVAVTTTVNTTLQVGYLWRERKVEPSELSVGG